MFSYIGVLFIQKRLVAAAKFLVAATKKLVVNPNFVAVTKPFFSVPLILHKETLLKTKRLF